MGAWVLVIGLVLAGMVCPVCVLVWLATMMETNWRRASAGDWELLRWALGGALGSFLIGCGFIWAGAVLLGVQVPQAVP